MAKKKENKGTDPIAERARALNEQIATLQAQIKKLDSQLQNSPGKPKLRSTAIPHGATISRKTETTPSQKPASEPVFEEIKPPPPRTETEAPGMFNELGVRKYDLPGAVGAAPKPVHRPHPGQPAPRQLPRRRRRAGIAAAAL